MMRMTSDIDIRNLGPDTQGKVKPKKEAAPRVNSRLIGKIC